MKAFLSPFSFLFRLKDLRIPRICHMNPPLLFDSFGALFCDSHAEENNAAIVA